ncbi:MAG: histidine phosphatase family protein [Oscillospiraceae bacterium]|nr:histidine phosphatase family protein [Oscillospiraceae bacterium]
MIVYLIRHGATAGNLKHRYIGRTDEPLCDEGRDAIKKLISPPCCDLFVSPMRRCAETASILYPDQQPVICEGFRECDFGDFEGKNYHELSGDPDYQAWIDSNGTLPFPNGEAPVFFKNRCVQQFVNVIKYAHDPSVFVVHGGTIMAICEAFHGGDYYDYQIPNGGMIRAVWDGSLLRDLEKL